jgi:transcriptional regulator with XRE-family HTH domain
MKRFHHLLIEEINSKRNTYRSLGKLIGLPAMSISDYVLLGTEPRLKALEAAAKYFNEPVAALLLEQDDNTNIEVDILQCLSKMNHASKKKLLANIKANYISATYLKSKQARKQKGPTSKTCEAL